MEMIISVKTHVISFINYWVILEILLIDINRYLKVFFSIRYLKGEKIDREVV